MRQLETEVEEAARRQACADLEAARSLEAARAELVAAQREAEVLRAGKGAEKDSALAALKVCAPHPSCMSTIQPVSSSPVEEKIPWLRPDFPVPGDHVYTVCTIVIPSCKEHFTGHPLVWECQCGC